MTLSAGLRKLLLTAHVSLSLGWQGAVAAFLALAFVGLGSRDEILVGACDIAMGVVARTVIVPLSLATVATGIGLSLGTRWGLIRHYWVLIKLLITFVATLILLLHMRPIDVLADAALAAPPLGDALRGLRLQLMVDAAAAMGALLVATALSVYKPRGLTRYGWLRRDGAGEPPGD